MDLNFVYTALGILTSVILIQTVSLLKLWVEVKAMQKSTHQVVYGNPFTDEQNFAPAMTDEERKKLTDDPFGNIM